MPDLIPTGHTFVNRWQCDENDHLNVQFFTAFAHDAGEQLHVALGFGPAARSGLGIALVPREDHIRYHREMREAEALDVHSAPVAVDERTLTAFHRLDSHYTGQTAGTIGSVTSYAFADGRAATLPAAVLDAARRRRADLPDNAKPRGAGALGPLPAFQLDRAAGYGLMPICRDVVKPAECGADGLLLPRHHFSRFSDGVGHLWHALGFDRGAMRDRDEGTIVLEMKCVYDRRLRAGDAAIVMSGVAASAEKTLHIVHYLFNAETGALAARAEAIGGLFDQRARRIVAFSDDQRKRLAAGVARLPFGQAA